MFFILKDAFKQISNSPFKNVQTDNINNIFVEIIELLMMLVLMFSILYIWMIITGWAVTYVLHLLTVQDVPEVRSSLQRMSPQKNINIKKKLQIV